MRQGLAFGLLQGSLAVVICWIMAKLIGIDIPTAFYIGLFMGNFLVASIRHWKSVPIEEVR